MASKVFTQFYADRTRQKLSRLVKQGRKPIGLAKPKLFRLKEIDAIQMDKLSTMLGKNWNENQFVRDAVSEKLSNSIYTELLKS